MEPSVRRYDTIAVGLLKKNAKSQFLTSCSADVNCASLAMLDVIHSFDWKSAVEHDGGV